MRHNIYKEEKLRRTSRFSIMLNSREAKAIGMYCSRFRIKNRSEFLRTAIMKEVLNRFSVDHPTLWEQGEPTLFSPKNHR